jgi:hypothetical protein
MSDKNPVTVRATITPLNPNKQLSVGAKVYEATGRDAREAYDKIAAEARSRLRGGFTTTQHGQAANHSDVVVP